MAKKSPAPKAGGYAALPTDSLVPNPWNPNRMSGAFFEKLKNNIEKTLKTVPAKGGQNQVPPVVVRPHPEHEGKFQIVDGWHRWKVYRALKMTEIPAFVIDVDEPSAKLLTANLNYLRGEKDPAKYTVLISDLLEKGMSMDELESLLPEDSADISDLITTYGDGEAIRRLIDEQSEDGAREASTALADDNVFVEVRYTVSNGQAKVIQKEIDRIGKALAGNNTEGRALEFMAVQSSQCDLPTDMIGAPKTEKSVEAAKGKPKSSLQERAKARLKKLKEEAE